MDRPWRGGTEGHRDSRRRPSVRRPDDETWRAANRVAGFSVTRRNKPRNTRRTRNKEYRFFISCSSCISWLTLRRRLRLALDGRLCRWRKALDEERRRPVVRGRL